MLVPPQPGVELALADRVADGRGEFAADRLVGAERLVVAEQHRAPRAGFQLRREPGRLGAGEVGVDVGAVESEQLPMVILEAEVARRAILLGVREPMAAEARVAQQEAEVAVPARIHGAGQARPQSPTTITRASSASRTGGAGSSGNGGG